jgi:solute:Na+ symporter, SSS family
MTLHLSLIDWLLVALYGAVLTVLAVRHTRGARSSAEEYILGGRLLTLPGFVAALVSTWYGGILGVGEFSYQYGIANWFVFGFPYYVFAIVFAFFFARRVRDSAVFSIPDILTRTYGRPSGIVGAVLVFFVSSPAPYFLMLGVLVEVVTGWPTLVCLGLGAVLTVAHVYSGGMRAVVRTDLLHFALMFGGFLLLLAFLVPAHGITPFIAERVPASLLTITGGNSWQYILVWFFIAMWTLVAPQFHQFTLSARTPATARTGILVSVGFWMVFDAITTLSGLYARALLPDLASPAMAYPLLAEAVLPPLAKGVFFLGMLATVLSTTDGLTFICAATVGRDVLAPLVGTDDSARIARLTQLGIVLTAVVSVAGAIVFPSVISLWYVIGTLFIPSLLLPLTAAYYPRLRVGPRATMLAMAGGFAASFGWFVAGELAAVGGVAQYPLALEPMYAGLGFTVLVYVFARRAARRRPSIGGETPPVHWRRRG